MTASRHGWILSPRGDVLAFGGSCALSLALLGVGHALGVARGDTPPWAWLALVVGLDVAHVWATLFRVYLDPAEVRRRPALYLGAPAAVYLAGVALHLAAARLFWAALAYAAVFHFVRQQYGWVAIARRRAGEASRLDAALDALAVYNATLFPIAWWHGHLPRAFAWLVPGDFVGLVPTRLADALHAPHLALMALWAARQAWLAGKRRANAPKVLVVATTWLAWYVGIVATDSDYAFTVTNVVVHGAPYLAFVWGYAARRFRAPGAPRSPARALVALGPLAYVGLVAALALGEEALWDRLVWHDRPWLFGASGADLGDLALALVVPLLAVPQATHYVLDGFVWRGGKANPDLARDLGYAPR